MRGIEPLASRMRIERSTTELHPHIIELISNFGEINSSSSEALKQTKEIVLMYRCKFLHLLMSCLLSLQDSLTPRAMPIVYNYRGKIARSCLRPRRMSIVGTCCCTSVLLLFTDVES